MPLDQRRPHAPRLQGGACGGSGNWSGGGGDGGRWRCGRDGDDSGNLAAGGGVQRHSVRKRWTIEKADENSNGIPLFVLHRANSDKLRFHLPSFLWHWLE